MRLVIDVADPHSTRRWCENALQILRTLGEQPEKVPFALPSESRVLLETIVCEWLHDAELGRPPQPRDYDMEQFRQLVLYWFNITKLTEGERTRLGIVFTPPEGQAFAGALAAGVAEALFASSELTAFAVRLEEQWRECQPGFTSAATQQPANSKS